MTTYPVRTMEAGEKPPASNLSALLEAVSHLLTSRGFTIRKGGELRGASGIEHRFDLVAVKGELTVCIDFARGGEMEFLSLFAKAVDVDYVDYLVIISSDKAGELPAMLAGTARLKMVIYETKKDLLEKISSHLLRYSQEP